MQTKLVNGSRAIRRRRDGSTDYEFYQDRAIRRRLLVHRAMLTRGLTLVRRAVTVCATAIGQLATARWQADRAKGAGAVGAIVLVAVASQAWAQSGPSQHGTGHHFMVVPSELKWTDVPSLPPGAQIAIIQGPMNEAKPFTARLKFPENYKIPPHSHPAIEHVTVISGTFHMGSGDTLDTSKSRALPPGSVAIMQPGTNHFAWTSSETIVQLHGVGPWGVTYVSPADDPRRK